MNLLKIDILSNDKGSAIIVALLMSIALSLAVFIAMDNTMFNSRMMRSNRDYRDNLYSAETGITVAVEQNRTTWLRPASNLFRATATFAGNPENAQESEANVTILDENNNAITVASYEVARVESTPLTGTLSAEFKYAINHQAPPRIGSGTSPKTFEIRRYGMRSTVQPENTVTVESGLSKTFNKN